jgi:hypothetical protein
MISDYIFTKGTEKSSEKTSSVVPQSKEVDFDIRDSIKRVAGIFFPLLILNFNFAFIVLLTSFKCEVQ